LGKNEIDRSFNILNLSVELYPNSPVSLTSLAAAYLWIGNKEKARTLFTRAQSLYPESPAVSLKAIFRLASRLEQARKMNEIFSLLDIATELYPRKARLYKEIGDMYLRLEQKEKAIRFYQKALSINPKYKEAKERLEKILKKNH
jgi:tetratricopeptide (TPR) repeat protein